MSHLQLAAVLALMTCLGSQAKAADPSTRCDSAALRASRESNVPLGLLQAISRVETGRGDPAKPWPWTINSEGQGYWFATRGEATDFARSEIAAGRTAFDMGCFQMNLRWHGQRFSSLDDMIDPDRNAQEAARFLSELHAERGNWTAAAAAYHSRDAGRARGYLQRVAEAVGQQPASAQAPAETTPRPNTYPLLVSGAPAALGSVVPAGQALRPLIGAE